MPKPPKREPTTDALEILFRHFYEGHPERIAEYEAVSADMDVGREIYLLREKAGLTQAQLAKLIGTSRSVISRLEDADYEGHSLAMLNRIAAALHQRVEIRFVPIKAEKAEVKTAAKAEEKKTPARPRRAKAAA